MQIIDFEKSTIKELEDKFREAIRLNNGLDNILKEILDIKGELYNKNTPEFSSLYYHIKGVDTKDKCEFIIDSIRKNFPKDALEKLEKEKEALKKKVKEEEKRIAEAFEALARKEEILNQAITNSIKNKE